MNAPRIIYMRGYTAVEVVIVLAIFAGLVTVTATTFTSIRNMQSLKVASQDVWLALRSAKSATLSSENDMVYGVRIESGEAIRFAGSSYTAGTSTNVAYPFPGGVTATTSLSGGTQDIIFTRLTGETLATGTITLIESRSGATSSMRVTQTGLVEIIQ